jgi:DNA-binding CsgD family transcriptional regulator
MLIDIRAGSLRAATAHHAESVDIAAAIGHGANWRSLDDILRAWSGDDEGTRAAMAGSAESGAGFKVEATGLRARWALAILHIGAGRYEESLAEAEFICTQNVLGFATQALPTAVEAAVKSDQIEKARRFLADLESRAEASGTTWALGLLARSRALLARSRDAENFFLEAIGLLQQTSVATDVAHAQLLYGEWLRHQRRQVDARNQLRVAYEFFSEMGALGFAKRAESELLAAGGRARPRSISGEVTLTPQERRVAELAADGLTNMEIAAQVFISSATVEYHLRKVYRKLGITSRRQLSTSLSTQDLSVTTDT